jgi:hypothetical protein
MGLGQQMTKYIYVGKSELGITALKSVSDFWEILHASGTNGLFSYEIESASLNPVEPQRLFSSNKSIQMDYLDILEKEKLGKYYEHPGSSLLGIVGNGFYFHNGSHIGPHFWGVVENESYKCISKTIVNRPLPISDNDLCSAQILAHTNRMIDENPFNMRETFDSAQNAKIVVRGELTRHHVTGLASTLMPYSTTYPWCYFTDQLLRLAELKFLLGPKFRQITFLIDEKCPIKYLKDFVDLGVEKLIKVPPGCFVTADSFIQIPEIWLNQVVITARQAKLLKESLSAASPIREKLVYIPRPPSPRKRGIINHESLENLLEKLGFMKVYPEEHSAVEMANLMRTTKALITTSGSSCINSLLMDDGIFIELTPASRFYYDSFVAPKLSSSVEKHVKILADYDLTSYDARIDTFGSFYNVELISKVVSELNL